MKVRRKSNAKPLGHKVHKAASARKAKKVAPESASRTRTWKQFEEVIVKIQKALAPDAEVRHNRRVRGVSRRLRQLDVAISKHVGTFPILIVVECRQYKRPVTIDKVESFVQKLRDVKASLGVMISPSGFDAGAKAVAAQNGIILKTFREAQAADWRTFLNEDSWLALTTIEITNLKAYARLAGSFEISAISLRSSATFDDRQGTVEELFVAWYKKQGPLPGIESSRLTVPFTEGGEFIFDFEGVAKKYIINKLLFGEVQDKVEEGREDEAELVTFIIDKDDILQNQPAVDLTPEDYERERDILNKIDITGAKRLIRAAIVKN